MTTAAEYLALARRCEVDNSHELGGEVIQACQPYSGRAGWDNPVADISDAARLMPPGWRVAQITEGTEAQPKWFCRVCPPSAFERGCEGFAATEAQARVAAALRAWAAMLGVRDR